MTLEAQVFADEGQEREFWSAAKQAFRPEDWVAEENEVRRYLSSIHAEIGDLYAIDTFLNVGGGGIAVRVIDKRLSAPNSDVYAVLKFPRPVQGQAHDLNEILLRETERLRLLRHQNLIRILTHGSTKDDGIHFYVMEYLDKPRDADDYLSDNPTLDNLISILRGAAAGLAYMHRAHTAHLDIKPANIFVAAEGTNVVIADLGFAKRVVDNGQTRYIGGTAGYKHPDHNNLIHQASRSALDIGDPNREMRLSGASREQIKLEWDIYSFGVTTLVLLRVLELEDVSVTSMYPYRYLKLMGHRMLGRNLSYAIGATQDIRDYGSRDAIGLPLVEDEYLGLRKDAMKALEYRSMGEVINDLDKLTGAADLLRSVPELSGQLRDVIQASSQGPVPFSRRIRQVVDSREVRALGRVEQLGLVRLVYPSASHSRLEHTLGTMAMATSFVRALLSDPISPIFKQLFSEEDVATLLAVCLVHDIGHYPLAHDLEEVERTVFSHERRTQNLLDNKDSELVEILSNSLWRVDPDRVKNILFTDKRQDLSLVDMIIKSVIDGPIDADKLDYLIRDSENLRLPYGRGIDVSKLLQCLTVVAEDTGNGSEARIGIHDKGRIPAESVAFARYAMYGSVYWHRTHRTLKAMVNRLGLEVLAAAKLRRGNYMDGLRSRLYEFIDYEGVKQLTLAIGEEEVDRPSSPYLDNATQRMIWWLVDQIPGNDFDELAGDILFRRLYRRILVVSRARPSTITPDWAQAERVFGRIGQNWEPRREVMLDLQSRITRQVSEWDGTCPPGVSTAGIGEKEAFILASRNKPLVLVDYPPVKSGSRTQLDYLRENEWSEDRRGDLRVDHLEASSMWNSLVQEYSTGLGKMRVYVHPKYASLILAAISRDELERVLWGSIKSVRV